MNLSQPLSREENLELIRKAQEEYKASGGKKTDCLNEAIKKNLRLIYYILNSKKDELLQCGIYQEAESACYEHIQHLVLKFDINRAQNFATFALYCLENIVKMQFRNNKKYYKKGRNISLDKTLINNDGEEISLMSLVEDVNTSYFEDKVVAKVENERLKNNLKKMLSEIQIDILDKTEQGYMQHELAKTYNCSRSYISRIKGNIKDLENKFIKLGSVKSINKFIVSQNLKGESARKAIAIHQLARNAANNQKVDFESCFNFLRQPLREAGMLKKLDKLTLDRDRSELLLGSLFIVNESSLTSCRKEAKEKFSVFISQNEKAVNNKINDVLDLGTDLMLGKNCLRSDYEVGLAALLGLSNQTLQEKLETNLTGYDVNKIKHRQKELTPLIIKAKEELDKEE